MKITKSQLKQIIKEEMEGRLDEVWGPSNPEHPDHEGFLKWQRMHKDRQPSGLKRELDMRPSIERRVDRIEEKLDELIRNLGGTAATEIELEE